MLLAFLLLPAGALQMAPMTRREAMVAGIMAPMGLSFAAPRAASASSEARQAILDKAKAREESEANEVEAMDPDPLTRNLNILRARLLRCSGYIEQQRWDDIRQVTKPLMTSMSFKGYTGESVKSRAEAWVAAGEVERAEEIKKRRVALLRNANALELAVFAAQTNDRKKMLSEAELQDLLKGTVASLDDVIAKMGCQKKDDGSDRRWRSGACEILPLAPELR